MLVFLFYYVSSYGESEHESACEGAGVRLAGASPAGLGVAIGGRDK